MSTGGVGGADGAGRSGGASDAGGVDSVGSDDRSVSESEASDIADDAVGASDDTAAAVGESMAASEVTDTVEVGDPSKATEDAEAAEAAARDEAAEAEAALDAADVDAAAEAELAADLDPAAEVAAEPAPAVEEPGLLEAAATWAGQTAKGYATGAVNGFLDMANVVNMGANAALGAVGVDYQFATEMHVAPTSQTEKYAQDAIGVASVVAGGVGLVRSAPALARGLDSAAGMLRSAPAAARGPVSGAGTAPVSGAAVASPAAQAARLGDLRPDEIARIQAAADTLGEDLYVVGSAAKGARRNVGSDLPLAEFGGTKAGTRSDIDYAIRNGADDAASALDLPDVDSSWGVRGVDYLNLDNSPAIRFSPGRAPELLSGGGRLNLD